MEKAMCDLNIGERAVIQHIFTKGNLRARLLDIGLIEGTRVECVGKSPGGDPSAYLIRGAVIAIRRSDARDIRVKDVRQNGA